ncbi:MAG: flagellar hook capping FlgD N-terminal domain-containing protein [Thermomicrobium sp.]|nr:flagellar hook capping FlgD N-terminal domain-containing protein [Thermomicrobium sp.]
MSVSQIGTSRVNTGATNSAGGIGTAPGGRLDKQAFLMLLVAQLRNQDPMNPIEDREFITQLAQLNALEQLQQLNETIAAMAQHTVLGQVAAFLGTVVSGLDRTSGAVVSGTVVRATIVDGAAVLELAGGQRVDVRDVVSVAAAGGGSEGGTGGSTGSGGNGDGADSLPAGDEA